MKPRIHNRDHQGLARGGDTSFAFESSKKSAWLFPLHLLLSNRISSYGLPIILLLIIMLHEHPILNESRFLLQSTRIHDEALLFLPTIPKKKRTILFAHVGKTGGMTLRQYTSLKCRLPRDPEVPEKLIQSCIHRYFREGDVLARQTTGYLHMWSVDPNELEHSTSFLMTLRNPVDRIISAYRYSHPNNCNRKNKKKPDRPFGCEIAKKMRQRRSKQYKMFGICFPSAGIEDFAQSVMSPYYADSVSLKNISNKKNQANTKVVAGLATCRQMARDVIEGTLDVWVYHMKYNHAYYANKTIWAYPDKELFAIRTEHEWEDMVALDKQLGGTGRFGPTTESSSHHNTKTSQNAAVSHGSEGYIPSPISTQGYHKLCCVLHEEIQIYMDLLQRAQNLNATAKQESISDLADKCNFTTSNWNEWRQQCQSKLNHDAENFHSNAALSTA